MQENANNIEELQKLLKDESERCNLHKQNYQDIKDEYKKLQEELSAIYDQLKETRSKNDVMKTTHHSEIIKLKNKIQEQEEKILSLIEKNQQFDPRKIRDAVLEEARNDYESKIRELDTNADRLRDQYNNLHYENAILKSKFDSRDIEFSRTVEKIQLEHLIEVERLQNKIKNLEREKSTPTDSYAVDLKSAKREILDLNQKIKGFHSECDDLRAQNENLTLQISALTRSNSKQTADNTNNLRILEAEKVKAMRQLEVCGRELSNSQEHRKALNVELQKSKQEILSLQTRIEEIELNSKVIQANLQAELLHFKSQYESEHEQLIEEITRLRKENTNLDESLSQERQIMFSKEQDFKKDLITSRQQYWKLSNEKEQEREMLERKIKELEVSKGSHIESLGREIQNLQQQLHACSVLKIELEKEITAMRGQVGKQQQNIGIQNSTVPQESLQIQKEIQELKNKFQSLAANFQKQEESKDSLNQASNMRNNQMEKDHEILQMKLTWEQQKLHFQQRLEELESQLRECRSNSVAEKRELEFKLKQYTTQVSKLKEKLDVQKEKLHTQKELIEKSVPAEVHFQVRNEFAELQKRVGDYIKLVTTEPGSLLKQPVSSQMIPGKMLADIKNTDFRSFSEHAVYRKEVNVPSEVKEIDKNFSKKKSVLSRRRPSKTKEKFLIPKAISPVLSSSSDIDWENL
ncbi:centrosomal protein of 83 kDa [Parasteatoda tepidariorum]|uniref:centrosomal protein of 83 kDa n=1 Tax=Parasteatoda tepidariorum TaxID=114398 RepID=UPI0039BCC21B